MKKLLITLVLVGFSFSSYSQTLIQTFTDRCTGATQVFQISMTGTTTVVFYDRAQTFTAADVQSGAFQAWLQETYAWWAALNPCSAAQAESQTAQQTTQQTTSAATSAASNAASSAPPPATGSTNTSSTNASSSTNNTASSSSTDSSSSSQSTDSSSSSSGESTQSETSDTSSGGETSESSGGGESSESEGNGSEETKTEESSDTESEEQKEEVKEEESKEESKEEESSEEESESSEEESSEDSESSEEEKEKKEKRKKSLAPPILAANMMGNQMLDGTWTTAASFGVSQSSLTGQETYSANAMIWSNLKQFSLGLSKSKVYFWSEYEGVNYLVQQNGKRVVSPDPKTGRRPKDRQYQIHHVGTTTFNYMNIYGTNVITAGYSRVIIGQNENFWKGFAGGYAATNSIIILPESTLYSPALTFFGTKPVNFRALPRWGFAPMVAVSLTPLQIINNKDQYNKNQAQFVWNEYFTYIIGTNANFNLTQRFVANIGVNTINNTNPIIPTTFAITIGARFAF